MTDFRLTYTTLCDRQHAYRKYRSCNTALRVLTNDIFCNIDKPKHKSVAVFIDLKKAFDSVNHAFTDQTHG